MFPRSVLCYEFLRAEKEPGESDPPGSVIILRYPTHGPLWRTLRYYGYAWLSMFAIVSVSCSACVVMLVNSPISTLAPASESA